MKRLPRSALWPELLSRSVLRARARFLAALSWLVLLNVEPESASAQMSPRLGAAAQPTPKSNFTEKVTTIPRSAMARVGRSIVHGLRVEREHWAVLVSRLTFPGGAAARGIELPVHLGGGFLFYQSVAAGGASSTAIYHAKTWTGELRPLALLPFPVRQLTAGFDRVYVLGPGRQVALDLQSGKTLPLDSLPPLITIEGLAFVGSRRAVVKAPLVGVVFTEDAGDSWWPLPDAESISEDPAHKTLLVGTKDGLAQVGAGGRLHPWGQGRTALDRGQGATGPRTLAADALELQNVEEATLLAAPSPAGLDRVYLELVTRGARFGSQAVAVFDGKLWQLSLDGTALLTSVEVSVPPKATCVATSSPGSVGGADRPLFLCRQQAAHEQAPLFEVFKWEEPRRAQGDAALRKAPRLVSVYRGSGTLLALGEGAVLFSGSCSAREEVAEPQTVCVVRAVAAHRSTLPRGLPLSGLKGAFAVSPEAAWVVWLKEPRMSLLAERLPEKGEPSSEKAANSRRRSYEISEDPALKPFFHRGGLISRASVVDGEIAVFATFGESFVGMRLGSGTQPSFGALQRPLRRALLDGPRAMVWGAAGFAKQTTNGGVTWDDVRLPYTSGDAELASQRTKRSPVYLGCTGVGCVLGSVLRLGWGADAELEVELPAPTQLAPNGAPRTRFACGSAGKSFRAPLGAAPPALPGWPHFWGAPAPQLLPAFSGVSAEFSDDSARLYGWGLSGVPWGLTGLAQLSFLNPYDGERVRKSALTPRLFASVAQASASLGLIERSTNFRYAAMDPGGESGVLILRSPTTTEIVSFGEGDQLQRLALGSTGEMGQVLGMVASRGRPVVAFSRGGQVVLARFEAGVLREFFRAPIGESGERGVELVRTKRGDLGLAMDGDAGMFVYPVSETGALGEPVVAPIALGSARTCPSEASGFLVDREVTVSPHFESESGESFDVTRLRARLIVGSSAPCVDAMTGRSRDPRDLPAAAPHPNAIAFTLLGTEPGQRRTTLLCH